MEAFTNVIRNDPKVRVRINDMLDRYVRLSYNYRSKIVYDCLIQNVILEELINIMGTTVTDLDIELKMEISRKLYLEKKILRYKNSYILLLIYINDHYICNTKKMKM